MSDPLRPEELETWQPQVPPALFAERVVAIAMRDAGAPHSPPPRRRRRWLVGSTLCSVAAAAAAALSFSLLRPSRGDEEASVRREVAIGRRAIAVLEPGAAIRWEGDRVTQTRGDVFYRVSPGGAFHVHTSAGDIDVKGTCFGVRLIAERIAQEGEEEMNTRELGVAFSGALVGALAVVSVFEGRVELARGAEHSPVLAGERATLARDGITKHGTSASDSGIENGDGTALLSANQSLAGQVGVLSRKLSSVESERARLEKQLARIEEAHPATDASARAKPSLAHSGVTTPTREEWAELAKTGDIKYVLPCDRKGGWAPPPEALEKLGLAPTDADAIQAAYARSNDRVWSALRPLCAEAIGSDAVAQKLGANVCIHLVLSEGQGRDSEAATEAMRQVGELHAGMRQAPEGSSANSPVYKAFLALTTEAQRFEQDLARSFGPDEARRLATADGMCTERSHFGGSGPRK